MPIPVEVYDFGEDMSLVYEWCANRVILNIARRFPYIADKEAKGVFEWQAKKLVEFGQCNQENMKIIRDSLKDVPEELARTLEEQIVKSVEKVEPELTGAAKAGLLPAGATVQPMSDSVKRSFQMYYEQAANKMNLVNTVMLDSTQQAYTGVVTDVVTKITNSQRYLNDAAGSVITGVESVNSAMRQAVNRMVENGLTGFVDHAGRHWRPEAYVQMDIRTTVANAARQSAFDRCDEFGSDIIQIDAHAGARPLCYPWQGKLISRADNARDVTDLYGTVVHVFALSETSYGQAAGLFGVNCRHFGTPFIPGFSGLMNKDLIQPKEENDQRYELTQQQRAMERDIRDARLKLNVAKARGDEEEAQRAKQRVTELTDRIEEFCESNGLPRRRDREYTPVNATWPKKTGPLPYNVEPYKGNAWKTGDSVQAPIEAPKPQEAPQKPKGKAEEIKEIVSTHSGEWTPDDLVSLGSKMSDYVDEVATAEETAIDSQIEKLRQEVSLSIDKAEEKRKQMEEAFVKGDVELIERLSKERDELYTRSDDLRNQQWELMRQKGKVKANATVKALGDVRPVGGVTKKNVSEFIDMSRYPAKKRIVTSNITDAMNRYPYDWLKKSSEYGTSLKPHYTTGRAYYAQHNGEIMIAERQATNVHELGHRFEVVVPEILKAEQDFYAKRTDGLSLEWLGPGYSFSEQTRKDDFVHPYMGKDYGGAAFELVSMGFQMALVEPEKLVEGDKEMYNWILGILCGL